ncbi:MAG: WYL domain-containing protein [Meiothermus sp.]|nr:WYL domain-containing protein [Meiothermus sp.]
MNTSGPDNHHRKAVRLFRVVELLRDNHLTVRELLSRYNRVDSPEERITLRTLQRALKDLVNVGQVEYNPLVRPPVYSVSYKLSPVEALVTHSALRLLFHHTPGYNAVYFRALDKLAHQLSQPLQSIALQSIEERRSLNNELGQALEVVAEGWAKRQPISFNYLKPTESGIDRGNVLEVYFVEISRSNLGLYVIGLERGKRGERRTFKLDRMRNVSLVGRPNDYAIPDTFDPRAYLSKAWGVVGSSGGQPVEVRLRFAKEAAYRILEGGYPNLSITSRLPDGGLEVCITVGTNNDNFPVELKSWVQSWGSRVEVLWPQDLREEWLEEARAVAALGGGINAP